MFAMDQDEFWKESADKATTALEPYKYHGDFQDIGYLFIFSYITGYKLTGNSKYRTVALEAADSLFDSLMPGGYLKCNWLADGEHYQGIDAMMNIGLWLWAFRETDNSKYRIAAEGCIDNILRTMIFSDGRTCEYVKFNGEDREIEIYNKNAAEANSVWSRGHSWAIYGMVQAFLNLGHFEYLDVIDKLTSFYQKNTDDSLIPHWDMLIKHQTTLRDASAASIVASALLQLASHLDDKSQKKLMQILD